VVSGDRGCSFIPRTSRWKTSLSANEERRKQNKEREKGNRKEDGAGGDTRLPLSRIIDVGDGEAARRRSVDDAARGSLSRRAIYSTSSFQEWTRLLSHFAKRVHPPPAPPWTAARTIPAREERRFVGDNGRDFNPSFAYSTILIRSP